MTDKKKLTLDAFCTARARVLSARNRCESVKAPLVARYGSECQLRVVATAGEQKRLEAADRAYGRASDAMFALLDASPRDWRVGVPSHWVLFHLPFEDAVRPLGEALSVVPPRAFGAFEDKR